VLSGWGNVIAANATFSGRTITGNLQVANAIVTGGNISASNVVAQIGTYSNLTVQDIPSNFHVTTKGYVNSLVVAFAIGLGS
jgi:hypothetical protein